MAGTPVRLILGDNLFYRAELPVQLFQAMADRIGAKVFAYKVDDPNCYGFLVLDGQGSALEIIERSTNLVSHYTVTGLYFLDEDAIEFVK